MMTVDTQSEQRALDEAVGRLSERFPSVDRDTVAKIVQEEYASLSGAKVRDYIPVLAENAATDRLRKVAKMVQPVVPENLGEFEPVDAETRWIRTRSRRGHSGRRCWTATSPTTDARARARVTCAFSGDSVNQVD
jgi:hypothetical protein